MLQLGLGRGQGLRPARSDALGTCTSSLTGLVCRSRGLDRWPGAGVRPCTLGSQSLFRARGPLHLVRCSVDDSHRQALDASLHPGGMQPTQPVKGKGTFLMAGARLLGAVAVLLTAGGLLNPQAAHARPENPSAYVLAEHERGSIHQSAHSASEASSSGYRYTGIDLAEARESSSTATASKAPKGSSQQQQDVYTSLAAKGVPLDYDDLMGSVLYDPNDIPKRMNKSELAEQLNAIMDQYDNEDFDLGIKQFMIEQAIQQDLEDGGGKGADNKDFEEKLAEALFADEAQEEKEAIRTEDIVDDAFTTEVLEEAMITIGDPASLDTAWRVTQTMSELSYTQLWTLVSEGHVQRARFFGPEQRAIMVALSSTAPGGARTCKVVVPPDPGLVDHLLAHGVTLDTTTLSEGARMHAAFTAQLLRYTAPFMFISAIFWLLHTWLLDPMPNAFRRQEFLRYRRELMHVASKLNFRSPAREVRIDMTGPDFIPWDEIHGIDEVKREITEIIDYLKNPGLLRERGVARIGGVLLAGAPGTGKTLLAKSIAAESGVKMFTCSGTDFYDVYTGVGARRIRETFEKLRNSAPAILFVDEFDALGAARGAQSSGDESASIINELLVQMDGFEDNRGIVLLGATNRPGAIDSALIRPGRFDRIIYMPLPDAVGRAKILQVHARNKAVDPNINWFEVSRAMAGFTGADCMGLMQRAARMAARQGRDAITEEDIYAAMENKALEAYSELTGAMKPGMDAGVPDPIPMNLRKAIATYEAGKALLAYITPDFEEVARVSVCPFNIITGYTLFVEDEDKGVNAILTRSDMESHMVVSLAGRCAEKLVMGEGEVTAMGAPDLFHANMIAREMVLSMGMGRRMGPVDLMYVLDKQDNSGLMLKANEPKAPEEEMYYHATDMSTEQSRVAMADVVELLEAAEAKAYYGLAINWKPLEALVQALLDRGVLQGKEVAHILETNGVIHFTDAFTAGYGWDETGTIKYPYKPEPKEGQPAESQNFEPPEVRLTGAAAKTWFAGTELDVPRGPDGQLAGGWHWNMPYTIRKDLPDWYNKEVARYTGM